MRKIVSKSCFTNLLNLWESKGVKALNKALRRIDAVVNDESIDDSTCSLLTQVISKGYTGYDYSHKKDADKISNILLFYMSYDLDLEDLTQYIKKDVTADFICAVTHYIVNGLELPKYAGKSDISIDVRTHLLNRYVTDNSTVVKSLTPYTTVEQVRDMLNRQ